MSIETINYILAKFYESLTSTQYLYQEEIKNPSEYPSKEVEPATKYRVEIEFMQKLIQELENLKDSLENFSF